MRTTGHAPLADGRPADDAARDIASAEVGGLDAADGAATKDGKVDATSHDLLAGEAGAGDFAADDFAADDFAADDFAADDAATDDAATDDAVPGDGVVDGPPPGCVAEYGQAPEFLLCEESQVACTFYTSVPAGQAVSCDASCAEGGGTCLSAGDDLENDCQVAQVLACDSAHRDLVCTCSRP